MVNMVMDKEKIAAMAAVAKAYEEKAKMSTKEASIAATGYLDAIDDVMEGVYYMLRTIGPIDATIWTTKKGHQVAGKLYAGN